MNNVRASAIVDLITGRAWSVEVTGLEPHAHKRVYIIDGDSDQEVAFEGIRLFCEEMESMNAS